MFTVHVRTEPAGEWRDIASCPTFAEAVAVAKATLPQIEPEKFIVVEVRHGARARFALFADTRGLSQ